MTELIQFLFVLAVPLALVAGAVVALFLVGALFRALDHPGEMQAQVQALFRRPPREPKSPGKEHYYKPYWLSR